MKLVKLYAGRYVSEDEQWIVSRDFNGSTYEWRVKRAKPAGGYEVVQVCGSLAECRSYLETA